MSNDALSVIDLLHVKSIEDASGKLCFLNHGNHCQVDQCIAWKTLVEYDYTDDPKKEEPSYNTVTKKEFFETDGSPIEEDGFFGTRNYRFVYEEVIIEWEKTELGGKSVYRRPRKRPEHLGYCTQMK